MRLLKPGQVGIAAVFQYTDEPLLNRQDWIHMLEPDSDGTG